MTTHLSGPVAVIRSQDDMLREAAERFHERARRENETARLGDLRVWAAAQDKPEAVRFLQDAGILGADAKLAEPYRNTQDGWDYPAGWQDERWPVREPGEKTGWPAPELAQDDNRKLFRWFADRLDSRRLVRELGDL
jgi:hypothetical protein